MSVEARWVFLTLVTLVLVSIGCGQADEPSLPQVDHLILVVVDTLRADVVGCYGGDAETPVMDRLASEGVCFTAARSHIPITGPSHASMFTSLWPSEHGVRNNTQLLDEGIPVVAELMQEKGFSTAAFVSLGVLKAKFGLDRGFESYIDSFGHDWFRDAADLNRDVLAWLEKAESSPAFLWVHYSDPHEPYTPPGRSYPEVRVVQGNEELAVLPTDGRHHKVRVALPDGRASLRFEGAASGPAEGQLVIVEGGRLSPNGRVQAGGGMFPWFSDQVRNDFVTALPGVIDLQPDDPTVEFTDFHFRLNLKLSPEETREAYLGEVEFVDGALGELLEALERAGWLERALVVLASDHGEGLGDHDHACHIDQLYDSLLHVPLIMWAPGILPAGVTVDSPVGLVDIFPTIGAVMGIDPPEGIRGQNLLPMMRGEASFSSPLLAQTFRPEAQRDLEAITFEGFKVIREAGSPALELFDLDADPAELHDLSVSRAQTASELAEFLDRILLEAADFSGEKSPIDEETRVKLRALGYEH